jgi:hypothetical protein
MTHIKAYTEDLDNNLTFEYDVADRDVSKLVKELHRENLTVEITNEPSK